ncbi:Response regulator receiver domain-containing protein [Humidesulfovibrio mexicanus]|uniref:Response regulator receiver domain-containing protein n=1 Tax=Humidesulfovibrio mexicanus TaxID=147047 RepID=A0A239C0X9_9BACT|nr:response regulator [Humidesulfovibrio mexicanus]SNS13897.1 Response regulator receiver domain-containing protein [Humidesulfovibrio mexicanus]
MGGARPWRVLVLDDEMHLRVFLKAVFESAGYEAATAKDGQEGLDMLAGFRPDLVCLDVMMPRQGGVRFLEGLRSDPRFGAVRVLVVSAVDGEAFRHGMALLRAGAGPAGRLRGPDGYVEKPATAEVILAEAHRILGGARKAPATSEHEGEA